MDGDEKNATNDKTNNRTRSLRGSVRRSGISGAIGGIVAGVVTVLTVLSPHIVKFLDNYKEIQIATDQTLRVKLDEALEKLAEGKARGLYLIQQNKTVMQDYETIQAQYREVSAAIKALKEKQNEYLSRITDCEEKLVKCKGAA